MEEDRGGEKEEKLLVSRLSMVYENERRVKFFPQDRQME